MKNINIKKGFPLFTENPVVGGPYELRSFGLVEVIKFNFLTSLRNYWAILDLKQRPKDYESPALTTELMVHILQRQSLEKYTLNKFLLSQTEYLEVWPKLVGNYI